MGPLLYDRVRETSTSTGTGAFTLDGAVTGYRSFSVVGNGNTCYYAIWNSGSDWEVGQGTYTASGTTLSRDSVFASSNGNALVSFGSGTKEVFLPAPVAFLDTLRGRSALVNGGFDFAQRQIPGTATTIAQDGYGADRWRMSRENADLQYQRIDTNGSLESGITGRFYGRFSKITSNGKLLIAQPIEAIECFPLLGRTVTFQIKMKASSSRTMRIGIIQLTSSGTVDSIPAALVPTTWGGSGTDPTLGANLAVVTAAASCSVTTAWQQFNLSVTLPSNSKNILCAVWSNAQFTAGDNVSLAEVGFYDGSYTRPWLPRLTNEELLLCQRFYEKDTDPDTPTTTASNGAGIATIYVTSASVPNTTVYGAIRFLTTKRVSPTMTIRPFTTPANTTRCSDGSGVDQPANSAVVGGVGRNGFEVQNQAGSLGVVSGSILLFHYEANAEM